MSGHADFLAAPPARRWTGTLPDLIEVLYRELAAGDPRPWRMLRGGAAVSVSRQDGRRRIRIARSQRPQDVRRFEAEVNTFATFFGVGEWPRVRDDSAAGIAIVLEEPVQPSAAAAAPCTSCGEPRDWMALSHGAETCTACSFEASRA